MKISENTGNGRVLLRDVARVAGVSLGTASKALAGTGMLAPDTRAAVLAAASELGYRSRTRSGQPSQAGITALGLVIGARHTPLTSNAFYSHVLHGVESACRAHDISLIYRVIPEEAIGPSELPGMVLRQQVQGLLAVSRFDSAFLAALGQVGVPVVLVDHQDDALELDAILVDDERGGYLATSYLISQGHRDPVPAIITGPPEFVSIQNRVRGYRRALREHGLTYDPAYVREGDLGPGSQAAVATLFDLPRPPTAIFCCNDMMAIGVLTALRLRGLSVPEDCSVIGYDDVDLAVHASPPLTTIHADKEGLGVQGVHYLLERVTMPHLAPRYTRLGVTLTERASVGPPPAHRLQ